MPFFDRQDPALLSALFDSFPLPILVVDGDVHILHYNAAAVPLLGGNGETTLRKRGGNALHCLHADDAPAGCGHGDACRTCMVRQAVRDAIAGEGTFRKQARMELAADGGLKELTLLVTATPFEHDGTARVMVILEDMTEIMKLRSLIPICMHCKKIRDEQNYWLRLERYFEEHMEIYFSHGICDDCLKAQDPELFKEYEEIRKKKSPDR